MLNVFCLASPSPAHSSAPCSVPQETGPMGSVSRLPCLFASETHPVDGISRRLEDGKIERLGSLCTQLSPCQATMGWLYSPSKGYSFCLHRVAFSNVTILQPWELQGLPRSYTNPCRLSSSLFAPLCIIAFINLSSVLQFVWAVSSQALIH